MISELHRRRAGAPVAVTHLCQTKVDEASERQRGDRRAATLRGGGAWLGLAERLEDRCLYRYIKHIIDISNIRRWRSEISIQP